MKRSEGYGAFTLIPKKEGTTKIKLNYKLKSGWKVAASSVNKWGDYRQSDIKVKNGTTLSLQANDTYIVSMCLKNKRRDLCIIPDYALSARTKRHIKIQKKRHTPCGVCLFFLLNQQPLSLSSCPRIFSFSYVTIQEPQIVTFILYIMILRRHMPRSCDPQDIVPLLSAHLIFQRLHSPEHPLLLSGSRHWYHFYRKPV